MNNKVAIWIVVVIVAGVLVWWFTKSPAPDSAVQGDEQAMEEQGTMSSESSFNELFAKGDKQKCVFTYNDEQSSQTGTAYFDGEQRMRGDFTTEVDEIGTFDTHIIRDGDWFYSWGGPLGGEMGTKINLSEQETAEGEANESVNLDERVRFDCERWSADSSKFELPSDIIFSEISTQFNIDANAGGEVQTQDQCSTCELLPEGDARSQCLEALNC